jgi:hypothetical protein
VVELRTLARNGSSIKAMAAKFAVYGDPDPA